MYMPLYESLQKAKVTRALDFDSHKRVAASFVDAFPHVFARTMRAKWRHPRDLALRLAYVGGAATG